MSNVAQHAFLIFVLLAGVNCKKNSCPVSNRVHVYLKIATTKIKKVTNMALKTAR
jgi:hypothetical protein